MLDTYHAASDAPRQGRSRPHVVGHHAGCDSWGL